MGFTRPKAQLIIIPCVALILILSVASYFEKGDYYNAIFAKNDVSEQLRGSSDGSKTTDSEMAVILAKVIEQRNNLSRVLNLLQQRVGQMECEKQKTSTTGGWCAQVSVENSGEHQTDRVLVPALAEFFKGKYVGSFGDGPGRYKQLLLDTGKLKGYDAYDGAPFTEKTSEGRVQFLDLTLAQYGLPMYDWILSLEVAEHIPVQYENTFVDNVVRHAREGIVLSWAKLGQGGYSHVNTRPIEYVKELFEKKGFIHDPENSTKLQNAASLDWLKWNTNVYWRKDRSNINRIKPLLT